MRSWVIVILGLVAFGLFGCTWTQKGPSGGAYRLQLGPDNKFSINGMKLTADDPLHDALLQIYEICGGRVEGDMANSNFTRRPSCLPGQRKPKPGDTRT